MSKRRKKKFSLTKKSSLLILTISLIVICVSLSYLFFNFLWDPIYISYDLNEPEKLDVLPLNDYDYSLLDTSNQYYHYEDDEVISFMGIDVSSNNGEIDWQQVKDSGIEFVYIRVGYRGYGSNGDLVLDSRFEENYKGAKSVDLKIGFYFFSQAINEEEAMEEAFFVLENLRHKSYQLPIAYDLETIDYDTARTDEVDGIQRSYNALAFCQKIIENGRSAIIYTNQYSAYEVFDLAYIMHYPIWLARYDQLPDFPYKFTIWQYSDKGEVPGIEKPTDLNIIFIDKNLTWESENE